MEDVAANAFPNGHPEVGQQAQLGDADFGVDGCRGLGGSARALWRLMSAVLWTTFRRHVEARGWRQGWKLMSQVETMRIG